MADESSPRNPKCIPEYNFPKVELHCHLDGCYRVETIAELGRTRGIRLPSDSPATLKKYISATTRCASLPDFLNKITIARRVIGGDADAITRIAREAVEDKAHDGIKYVEFRYSPQSLANCDVEPCTRSSGRLRPRDVIDVVNKALKEASVEFGVMVRTILCEVTSNHSSDWSAEVVSQCEEYRNSGVVGFDIAEPEGNDPFPASVVQAYHRCENLGIHRTAQAGEVGPASRVKQAIEELHCERIGHGYHVVDDSATYEMALEKRTHFEVCLLSSYLTTAVPPPWSSHPAKKFLTDGMNFGLNTDDPGITAHGLLRDYDIAVNDLGFSEDTLKELNLNAAKSCFLDGAAKQQLITDLMKE